MLRKWGTTMVSRRMCSVKPFTGEPAEFNKLVGAGASVVDFYADWCGPCKAFAPTFGQLSEKYKDAKFYKINVDDNEGIAADFSIRSIPTFVVFKDGKVVRTVEGGNRRSLESAIALAQKQ